MEYGCGLGYWSAWHRIEYFVDLGCALIPVGKGLTEKDIAMFYDDAHQNNFSNLVCNWDHRQFKQRGQKVHLPGGFPHLPGFTRVQNPDVIAPMLDGEAIHKYEDYDRIIKSPVGLRHILWQLREAGYEASFVNHVLSVSYRDYNLSPPITKQTFLKYVQSSLKSDISLLGTK